MTVKKKGMCACVYEFSGLSVIQQTNQRRAVLLLQHAALHGETVPVGAFPRRWADSPFFTIHYLYFYTTNQSVHFHSSRTLSIDQKWP